MLYVSTTNVNSESPPRAKKQIAKGMSVEYQFVLECNRIITLQY